MKKKQGEEVESQLIVPTPLWLQRRMLKNLQLPARSRVNLARAQRALEILATIRVDSKPQTEPVRESCVEAVSPAPQAALARALQIRRFAAAVFSKVRSSLIKARALFHLGISKVNIKSALPAGIERPLGNQ